MAARVASRSVLRGLSLTPRRLLSTHTTRPASFLRFTPAPVFPSFVLPHRRCMSQKTFADPHRPDLFYHTVQQTSAEKPTFALSFLPDPPATPDSATIIGWLPPQAPKDGAFQGFIQNDKFRKLLQEAVRDGIEEGVDEVWINGALQLQEGWMHIFDQRNIPDLGRIPDVDDIIGTVLVKDSKIQPETYFAMQYHRLCTADGIVQLTPGLSAHLREFLTKAAVSES